MAIEPQLLYKSSDSQIYLEKDTETGKDVIVKVLNSQHPTPEMITQFNNELSITSPLNIDGIRKALRASTKNGKNALLMEYVDGSTLEELASSSKLTIEKKLDYLVQIAKVLHDLHQEGVIHKDLNPRNVLVDLDGQVKIIDFGNSSHLNLKSIDLSNPKKLEGTLQYISPEQTGRMNRVVDHRSDLYSFGALAFYLLVGRTPFDSKDELELIHCHLAKTAPSLSEFDSSIPTVLSNIVGILLSKNAEDRYQTAYGLMKDLEKCLQGLREGSADEFELQQDDASGKLLFPERLYGRENEIKTLLDSFERASKGPRELTLVAGYSGIGKSALVNELHRPITEKRGRFISGKFDQMQRSIPHYAFINAIEQLVDNLLTLDEDELNPIKDAILDSVGSNAGVLTYAIPTMEHIIGKHEEPPQTSPIDALNRFNWTLERFFYAIASEEHPLVIFIDDLQWADSASFNLLTTLATSIQGKNLLLIGAYRNNEINADHQLPGCIEGIKDAGTIVSEMELSNLSLESINEFISDTLKCGPWYSKELSDIVFNKTKGNCFYVKEILKDIYSNGLLTFDTTSGQWSWDTNELNQLSISENVGDILLKKAEQYPASTQDTLKVAAVVGNTFNLKFVSSIVEDNMTVTLSSLWKAIEDGWIIPKDSTFRQVGIPSISSDELNPKFRFAHDKVQEAALNLMDESEMIELNYKAGLSLLSDKSIALDEKLFDIANHFIQSKSLLEASEVKNDLIGIYLTAANKAENSAAFVQAQQYVEFALDLLPKDCWKSNYEMAFNAHKLGALCNVVLGNFDRSKDLIDTALEHVNSDLHKVECLDLLLTQYMFSFKYAESLQTGREALQILGIDFPEGDLQPLIGQIAMEIQGLLEGKSMGDIQNLPAMTDPTQLTIMRLLGNIGPTTYVMGLLEEWTFTVLMSTKVSLMHGNSPFTPYAYVQYGMVIGAMFNEKQAAYAFGDMACKLADSFGKPGLDQKSRCNFILAEYLQPWVKPFVESEEVAKVAVESAIECGNNLMRGYMDVHRVFGRYYQGVNLEVLSEFIDHTLAVNTRNKMNQAVNSIIGLKMFVDYLQTTGDDNIAAQIGDYLKNSQEVKDIYSILQYQIFNSQIEVLKGDFNTALAMYEQSRELMVAFSGQYPLVAPRTFFGSMAMLRVAEVESDEVRRQALIEEFRTNLEMLQMYAKNCSENFQNKIEILLAEKARFEGKMEDAVSHYKSAIKLSIDNDFLSDQALANELIGDLYIANNDEFVATSYLSEAYYLYGKWGAKRKQLFLTEKYPNITLSTSKSAAGENSTVTTQNSSTGGSRYDLMSVMKATEVISSEIHLDKLISNLIQVAAENAGAQKGAFLRNTDSGLEISGVYGYDLQVPLLVKEVDSLPMTVVNYSVQKKELVVIDNSKSDPRFITDAYFKSQDGAQSVLAMPIMNQGNLVGLLLLTNEIATAAFDEDRVDFLKMLSGQIAVSIENATLYQSLEKKVEQRTRQLQEEKAKTEELLIGVQEQKERAEKSEAFKQQFLANMSHEIRTPMNAVMGMTNLVLDTELDAKQRDYLTKVKKSSENLLHIINDILDLSKIEAGKMELEEIDFSISNAVEQVKNTLQHKAEEKGLELLTRIDTSVRDIVMGDPVRLNQVLINLAGNAIKFTEQGSVSIDVTSLDGKVRFSIIDTGIGIPEDKIKTVFENFGQANTSDTRKYGGTGLGLSISQQLVSLMGGSIDIESEVGKGTTFFFDISLAEGDKARYEERIAGEGNVDGSILNGLTVLIADDNEYNRIVARDTLVAKSDVTIIEAENGQEAIDKLTQNVDVILMDAQMPVLSGFDATEQIRQHSDDKLKNIPIIALTASVMRTDLDRCKDAGMNGYIPKPFKAHELVVGIADALDITLKLDKTISKGEPSPSSNGSSSNVTNLEYLRNFCGGDEEKMQKYVDMFVKSAPKFITDLESLIERNDAEGIANHVHGFNTKLTMMGMKESKSRSINIENALRDSGTPGQVSDAIQALLQDVKNGIDELSQN